MASHFGNLSRLGLVCVLPGRRGGASCYNRGFVLMDRRQTRCYLETWIELIGPRKCGKK